MSIADIKNTIKTAELIKKEAPQPLRKLKSTPGVFPVDSLPPLFKNTILALHDKIQAPIPICAQSVLATANLAVQGYADIMLPIGQTRPIACFFLTIAASGERKSSCDNEILKVIEDYEAELRNQHQADMASYQNALAAWDKQRQDVLKDSKRYPDHISKKEALDKIGKKPDAPCHPIIICADPTIEGLCKLLGVGMPTMGVFSSEGGQFIGGYGMKEEHKIRTAATLSDIWDGKAIKRVRAGDGAITLSGKRVCMHLMTQPDIATQFLSDHALKDQGLLSRILVASPATAAGTRLQHDIKPNTSQALYGFKERIGSILTIPLPMRENCINELEPRILPLSDDSKKLYAEFADHIEKNMAPGKSLEPIRGLAGKLPEHALRIGATIALTDNIYVEELEYRYLKIGIEIIQYYADEALRLFDEGRIDPDILLAEKLLYWMHNNWEEDNISLPDIYQRGLNTIGTKAVSLRIVRILEDHGWLLKNNSMTFVKGCNRKDSWRIVREEVL